MSDQFVIALDQGTTSSRAILFDHAATIVDTVQQEFTQIYPKPGWVEHDAQEIWDSQFGVLQKLVAQNQLTPADIAALGITNQRETTLLWERSTGKPIANAIVWQDRRTAGYCDQLKAAGHESMIRAKTGLLLDAYFSGTKIKWLLDNVSGARAAAERGELAFGTMDTWLIWNLTDGKVHATDASNASRTLLMNIDTCEWDTELLTLFDIPESLMPQIRDSSGSFGALEFQGQEVAITGVAGDQQAALFGQACMAPGMAKNTYGTGCFLLMNTGEERVHSNSGLLSTVAWRYGGKTTYALEGSVFVAGAAIQWLRDGLAFFADAAESEALANQANPESEVMVVPAFAGLGAPHWDMYARGAIFGLTRDTGRAEITKATLESLAYQTNDVLAAMQDDSGIELDSLHVDGGAIANNYLAQFQADIIKRPIKRPHMLESTALGAAFLAGLHVGYWTTEELSRARSIERTFTPEMAASDVEARLQRWNKAVDRTGGWLAPSGEGE